MDEINSFWLEFGRKHSWFDCHRRFLPPNHSFRKSRKTFRKDTVEKQHPPIILDGDSVWQFVKDFPKVTESGPTKLPGFGTLHNWTKKSIGIFLIGKTIC